MELKTIATIVIVFAAIAIGYFILSSPPPAPIFMGGTPATGATFLSSLAASKTVYLVQDLRGANSRERLSIQQCSVDFAGSRGLIGKEKMVFAFEGANCVSLDDAKRDLKSCISELEGKTVLYIRKGNDTHIYENALVLGLGEQYSKGACDVAAKNPSPSPSPKQAPDKELQQVIDSIEAEKANSTVDGTMNGSSG